jgi:hypothetical protein
LSSSTKEGKELRSEEVVPLLVVLHLLIVDGLVIIIIIIIIIASTTRTNAESSQLSRSQRCIGVEDGWEDRDVEKVKKRLIPLAVNDLLVASNNL